MTVAALPCRGDGGPSLTKCRGRQALAAVECALPAATRSLRRLQVSAVAITLWCGYSFYHVIPKELLHWPATDPSRDVRRQLPLVLRGKSHQRRSNLASPLAGEGSGGEMGISRSLLRAQRALPACMPECARQGRAATIMAVIIRDA